METWDQGLRERLLATFRVEADEHVLTLTSNLTELERGLPPERAGEVVEATFRAMHTLKGAARSVGLMELESLCQACELILSRAAKGRLELTPGLLDTLQAAVGAVAADVAGQADPGAVDELTRRLEQAADQGGAPATPAAPPRPLPEARTAGKEAGEDLPAAEVIRLDARKLDALLLEAEELLGVRLAIEERTREAQRLLDAIERLRAASRRHSSRGTNGHGALSAADPAMDELPALEASGRALVEHLARDRRAIAGAVERLLDEVRRARMTPASMVLDLFPRMVRDLARDQGKEVEWSCGGGELEIDRRVLDAVKDPLIHLVRNAIDHGIEPPDVRVHAGKPPQGRVTVTVSSREDGRVGIVVEDDGRGIDPGRVRDAAVRGRLLSADGAGELSSDDALELVFRSGLSTSPVITQVSGHGLGLAIVRERVELLDGEMEIDNRPGRGMAACMVLPASIATFRGLLVRAAGRLFLLPLDATERVLARGETEAGAVAGRSTMRWRDEALPLTSLEAVLGLPAAESRDEEERLCVIVRASGERIALLVDAVLGEREVLVKELGAPLVRVRNVGGAGVLGSGELVLILRSADLVRSARLVSLPPAPRPAAREDGLAPAVLVVDDAVTTRTMERNLLEAAGYRVTVAVDGLDAWTALRADEFDLVVSDVDMPRMDGFDLTARIRADSHLADLPVVLVTALESREDKERGIEVGANAYVVKSSFDQSNLLEILRRLGVAPDSGSGW